MLRMLRNKIISILLLGAFMISILNITNVRTVKAAEMGPESFEDSSVPSGWSEEGGGNVSISTAHAKSGSKSLQWDWVSGSKLQLYREGNMQDMEAAIGTSGGIKFYIYNEVAIGGSDGYITVNLGTSTELAENNPRYSFKVYMNFTGWRAVHIRLENPIETDIKNPDYIYSGDVAPIPDTMQILPPSTSSSGKTFIDLFDLTSKVEWKYAPDYQLPYLKNEPRPYYSDSQRKPVLPLPPTITEVQKQDFALIKQRFDDYLYGNVDELKSITDPNDPRKKRLDTLITAVTSRVDTYNGLNITRDSNGNVSGPGLFCEKEGGLYSGGKTFSDMEKIWTGLVWDYKLNGNAISKQKYYDMLDWADDQGWHEGSSTGSVGEILLRMSGYAYSLYMMKDELKQDDPVKYEREVAKLKWYTRFGQTYGYVWDDPASEAPNTDVMRTEAIYDLMYILMMDDSPEKVQAMQGYLDFLRVCLQVNSGLGEIIKPGYTAFHHDGIYAGPYVMDAMYTISQIRYFMDGTSFELDSSTVENLRQFWITQRSIASKYYMSSAINGRFPEYTNYFYRFYPVFALHGLCGDDDMKGIYLDLWDYGSPSFNTNVASRNVENNIFYDSTIGQLPLMKRAYDQFITEGKTAIKAKDGFDFKDYGSIAFYRKNNWVITTKGFNQYNWDFEQDSSNNIYGRYISYGNTQIILDSGTDSSGLNTTSGWNFSRWPGITAKNLPLDNLKSDKMRNFSDETFAGGVSSHGEYGVFSMRLHDTYFDPSFRANKSWFYFGDQIIALGSDIKNDDTANNTETTLFQSNMNGDKTKYIYNNSSNPINAYPYNSIYSANEKVWLTDPFGNGYIIPNASGLNIKRGDQTSVGTGQYTTAWLDHGTAPNGAEYEYVILPQKPAEQVAAIAAKVPDYTVLRKDNKAHILKQNTLNTIGYAVFDNTVSLDYGVVHSVDTPVLMMEKNKPYGYTVLSLSDPDLRLYHAPNMNEIPSGQDTVPSGHKDVHVELKGSWVFNSQAPEGVTLLGYDQANDITTLKFDCYEGKNFDVDLKLQDSNPPPAPMPTPRPEAVPAPFPTPAPDMVPPPPPGTVLFSDDLSSGDLNKWSIIKLKNSDATAGGSVTAGGAFSLTGNVVARANDNPSLGNYQLTDYILEVDTTITKGQSGITFRTQGNGRDFYMLDIRPVNGDIKLLRLKNTSSSGQPTMTDTYTLPAASFIAKYGKPLAFNTTYKIKIVVTGNKFTVFIDGIELLSASDPNYNIDGYKSGTVGFRLPPSCVAEFDNIKVTRLPIGFDKSAVLIMAGDTEQLRATVTEEVGQNQSVKWSVVSGQDIVAVSDSGLVTGLRAGDAVVRATSIADETYYAECSVTVNEIVHVTYVGLEKEASLYVGQEEYFTPIVLPDDATKKSVVWSVYNGAEVVSVSPKGLVTALSPGYATIRATSVTDSTYFADCNLTIYPVPIVNLNMNLGTLNVGQTEQLTATVTPEGIPDTSVFWWVSKQSAGRVAKVSPDGLVTALNPGKATIRAISVANQVYYAEYEVTVISVTPVTGIYLDKSAVSIEAGAFAQLEASVIPLTADNRAITFESSNTDIATVSNATYNSETGKYNVRIAALSAGTATITARSVNGGYVATCAVVVTSNSSGIDNEDSNNGSAYIDEKLKTALIETSPGKNTVKPFLVGNGVTRAILAVDELNRAFKNVAEGTDGVKTIEVFVQKVDGANNYEIVIPSGNLSTKSKSKNIILKTDIAQIVIPDNMLKASDVGNEQNVTVSIAYADKSVLNEVTRKAVGDRPVIDLKVMIGNKTVTWKNNDAPVTVAIPYTPTEEELKNSEKIVIWCIDESGSPVTVPSGKYNPATGLVTFNTPHFSNYAIAFVTKTFEDISSYEWAKKAIEVLSAKGIINGTTDTTYAPSNNIRRADFIKLLISTLGLTAETNSNFNDVKSEDYYYTAVGIAKKLGITNGVGNNLFDPDSFISRQDMMTMTARAMSIAGKLIVKGNNSDLVKFNDSSYLAGYAVESIASLVKDGIIQGQSGAIAPNANATRAEVAVLMYRIYNK